MIQQPDNLTSYQSTTLFMRLQLSINRSLYYCSFSVILLLLSSIAMFLLSSISNSKFQDTDIVKRHESCLVHEPVTRQEVLLRMGLVDFD